VKNGSKIRYRSEIFCVGMLLLIVLLAQGVRYRRDDNNSESQSDYDREPVN
jgi:uncharacterized membrane protein